MVHPDDLEPAELAMWQARELGTEFDRTYRRELPGGPPRVIHANALVDRDDEGRPLRMIGINRDVTERSELERNLERARIQAEVADEAKTRLLARISHEIRTPAGAVLGNAD